MISLLGGIVRIRIEYEMADGPPMGLGKPTIAARESVQNENETKKLQPGASQSIPVLRGARHRHSDSLAKSLPKSKEFGEHN